MVRNYVRKTQKGSYSEDVMQCALESVLNKEMSIKKASMVFKIPRTSIHSRLKRQGLNSVGNLGTSDQKGTSYTLNSSCIS